MPRPSRIDDQRRELMPVVARAFAELGYRRTSTAELAHRCGVRENILYRLWPDKKAMFIAAIHFVYEVSAKTWETVLTDGDGGSSAERILDYEARHSGQFGNARIVFAGLSETDDPDIRRALADMYKRYQTFVREQVVNHHAARKTRNRRDDAGAAWGLIGLGTVALIAQELKLLSERDRQQLMAEIGRKLLA